MLKHINITIVLLQNVWYWSKSCHSLWLMYLCLQISSSKQASVIIKTVAAHVCNLCSIHSPFLWFISSLWWWILCTVHAVILVYKQKLNHSQCFTTVSSCINGNIFDVTKYFQNLFSDQLGQRFNWDQWENQVTMMPTLININFLTLNFRYFFENIFWQNLCEEISLMTIRMRMVICSPFTNTTRSILLATVDKWQKYQNSEVVQVLHAWTSQ